MGWLNTKMWDQTHDAQKSQGWTALVLDTNGNGKRDPYVEGEQKVATAPSGESLGTSSALNAAADPTKDTRLNAAFYGVAVGHGRNGLGLSAWLPRRDRAPEPGTEPARNSFGRILRSAMEGPEGSGVGLFAAGNGHRPQRRRLGGTGQRASGKLRPAQVQGPLNGPKATGRHCPEGWTLYQTPGPKFKNVTASGSADSHYYVWVDQFDTLGLGQNTPIITGNSSDSLLALVNGKFTILRVPYPLGFFAKGMDGRFDDPKAAGRAKESGPPGVRARPSTARREKGPTLKWSTFRFAPIHSLTEQPSTRPIMKLPGSTLIPCGNQIAPL